jgi:hypothetical protein
LCRGSGVVCRVKRATTLCARGLFRTGKPRPAALSRIKQTLNTHPASKEHRPGQHGGVLQAAAASVARRRSIHHPRVLGGVVARATHAGHVAETVVAAVGYRLWPQRGAVSSERGGALHPWTRAVESEVGGQPPNARHWRARAPSVRRTAPPRRCPALPLLCPRRLPPARQPRALRGPPSWKHGAQGGRDTCAAGAVVRRETLTAFRGFSVSWQ